MSYKLFYPNLLIEPFDLKKVYLGLTTSDFRFCYKEIPEADKEDYKVQIPLNEIKLLEKNMSKDIKEQLVEIKKRKNQIKK